MTQAQEHETRPPTQRAPGDWAKLIHKLRWIGLEDEARSLQLAVSTLLFFCDANFRTGRVVALALGRQFSLVRLAPLEPSKASDDGH